MEQKTFFDMGGINDKGISVKKTDKDKSNKKGRHIKKAHIKKSKSKEENRECTEPQDYESFFVSVERNGGGRNKVVVSTRCKHIRDNNVGLYCRLGTRKVMKIKEKERVKIVCLDCDEPGKVYEKIAVKLFNKLWERKRNG